MDAETVEPVTDWFTDERLGKRLDYRLPTRDWHRTHLCGCGECCIKAPPNGVCPMADAPGAIWLWSSRGWNPITQMIARATHYRKIPELQQDTAQAGEKDTDGTDYNDMAGY